MKQFDKFEINRHVTAGEIARMLIFLDGSLGTVGQVLKVLTKSDCMAVLHAKIAQDLGLRHMAVNDAYAELLFNVTERLEKIQARRNLKTELEADLGESARRLAS